MAGGDEIPDEIWFSCIFTKLSSKSVLTCRCVCRSWNRAAYDPQLARNYFFRRNKPRYDKIFITTSSNSGFPKIFIDKEAIKGIPSTGCTVIKRNLGFSSQVDSIEILGSSYGLLCASVKFVKRNYASLSTGREENMVIWNPSTGDSKYISLAYRPWLGFLYDPFTNDVNIVRIWNFGINKRNQVIRPRVDTYSVKNNLWNDDINVTWGDSEPLPWIERVVARAACLVNEHLMYWMVDITQNRPRVLEYNVRERKIRTLPMPRDFREKPGERAYMKEVGPYLGVFSYLDDERFVVWTMKESGEWSNLVNLDPSFIAKDLFKPICLMRNGKLFLLYRDKWTERSICSFVFYDPVNSKIAGTFDIPWSNNKEHVHQAVTYVDSIFSPTSISRGY